MSEELNRGGLVAFSLIHGSVLTKLKKQALLVYMHRLDQ